MGSVTGTNIGAGPGAEARPSEDIRPDKRAGPDEVAAANPSPLEACANTAATTISGRAARARFLFKGLVLRFKAQYSEGCNKRIHRGALVRG